MNTKKIVAMIIALIMTTATFAGCGNNTVDHKDSEVSSTVETNIDKTVEEKSEDKKSETADKTNATETADKKDSKETSNKAEKPHDNKVADKSNKDKGSANNSNSSVSKPSTPDKPNKPSGNNSGSSNNGNHNGSVNKPSKPVEKPVEKPSEPSKPVEKPVEKPSEKPSEPQKPAPHVCNFNIWKDEVSHTEMVTETYTEQVPKYKWISYDECRKCGFQSSDYEVMGAHCLECGGTYTTKKKQVQDGFETVTKTRQVPKTVVDDPAHYECSCGKRK